MAIMVVPITDNTSPLGGISLNRSTRLKCHSIAYNPYLTSASPLCIWIFRVVNGMNVSFVIFITILARTALRLVYLDLSIYALLI
jgi:hypothetical protein